MQVKALKSFTKAKKVMKRLLHLGRCTIFPEYGPDILNELGVACRDFALSGAVLNKLSMQLNLSYENYLKFGNKSF